MNFCLLFDSKQEYLKQQGEMMRLENQKNNNSNLHKFQWPIYSVKRKHGKTIQDIENANSVGSTTSSGVRSILAQVGSMRLEDGEETTFEVEVS